MSTKLSRDFDLIVFLELVVIWVAGGRALSSSQRQSVTLFLSPAARAGGRLAAPGNLNGSPPVIGDARGFGTSALLW